jgi:TorA maturation chaperone TorD
MTSELLRALAVVSEGASPAHHQVAASLGVVPDTAAHTDLFTFQLPPYAAIYLGAEGMLGGEAAGRIAGFWHALGYQPPAEPDHLAALLGLYAALADAGATTPDPARRLLRTEARRVLLWEHLLPWVPLFATAAARVAGTAYRPWAILLEDALLAEMATLAPYEELPVHLRAAPPTAAPEEDGLAVYLSRLLAPIRSGMVITRRDLTEAARRLGLGLRMGGRRFVLGALVAQDPRAMFGWLADEARAWANEHGNTERALGPIAGFWRSRAEEAETNLRSVQKRSEQPLAASRGR